jgi:hypothetical protein
MLGCLTSSGAKKRLPSLKVGEVALYKNELVYVVLCEDNSRNCNMHPCEDEVDGDYGVDFQYDGC